jgi:hypothetical protein
VATPRTANRACLRAELEWDLLRPFYDAFTLFQHLPSPNGPGSSEDFLLPFQLRKVNNIQ